MRFNPAMRFAAAITLAVALAPVTASAVETTTARLVDSGLGDRGESLRPADDEDGTPAWAMRTLLVVGFGGGAMVRLRRRREAIGG